MKVNSTSAAKESNPSRAVNHYISETSGNVRASHFLESSHTDTDGLIGVVPKFHKVSGDRGAWMANYHEDAVGPTSSFCPGRSGML